MREGGLVILFTLARVGIVSLATIISRWWNYHILQLDCESVSLVLAKLSQNIDFSVDFLCLFRCTEHILKCFGSENLPAPLAGHFSDEAIGALTNCLHGQVVFIEALVHADGLLDILCLHFLQKSVAACLFNFILI